MQSLLFLASILLEAAFLEFWGGSCCSTDKLASNQSTSFEAFIPEGRTNEGATLGDSSMVPMFSHDVYERLRCTNPVQPFMVDITNAELVGFPSFEVTSALHLESSISAYVSHKTQYFVFLREIVNYPLYYTISMLRESIERPETCWANFSSPFASLWRSCLENKAMLIDSRLLLTILLVFQVFSTKFRSPEDAFESFLTRFAPEPVVSGKSALPAALLKLPLPRLIASLNFQDASRQTYNVLSQC